MGKRGDGPVEDILRHDMPEVPFPGWTVSGPIGEGSSGVVYLAEKTSDGVTEKAAVKIISFPKNRAELDALRSEGITSEGAKKYYLALSRKYSSEISLMESLRGCENIVAIEDHKIVMRPDGVGFDLYIMMEYLSPIFAVTRFGALPEDEIVKMGRDVCRALEACDRLGVIHRDVKPENIFVDGKGNYKLGDFGIARVTGENTYGMTNVGTRNYMAPEVAAGTGYDRRADIYSLGLAMYRLGNGGKLPFLESDSQLIDPAARLESVERRLGGEQLPPPGGVSGKLGGIILKACAYRPADRFSSPAQMREALEGKKKKKAPGVCLYRIAAGALVAVLAAAALSASAASRREQFFAPDGPGSAVDITETVGAAGGPRESGDDTDGKDETGASDPGKTNVKTANAGKKTGASSKEDDTGDGEATLPDEGAVPSPIGDKTDGQEGTVGGVSVVKPPVSGASAPSATGKTDSGGNSSPSGSGGSGGAVLTPADGKQGEGNGSTDQSGNSQSQDQADDQEEIEPSPFDVYFPADGSSFGSWLTSLGPVRGFWEDDDYDGVAPRVPFADQLGATTSAAVRISDEICPSLWAGALKEVYLLPTVSRGIENLFAHSSVTDVYYGGSSARFCLIPPTAGMTTPVYNLHTVSSDGEKLLTPSRVFESSSLYGAAKNCFDGNRDTGLDFDWDARLKNDYGYSDYSSFPQDYVEGDGSYHRKYVSVDPGRYYFGAYFDGTKNVDLLNVIYRCDNGTALTGDMIKLEYTTDGSTWREASLIGTSVYPSGGGGYKSARFAFSRVAARGVRISFRKVVSKYVDDLTITDVYICDFPELGGGGFIDSYVFR